jgi:hypothetical protein
MSHRSNLNPLNFPDTDVIVAPIIQARGFCIQVPGHALRHFDTSAVRQVQETSPTHTDRPLQGSLPSNQNPLHFIE